MLTLHFLLLVLAFICFFLAAVGVVGRINLVALGLAFWVLTLLIHG
jgi:hypothetical protein